jgi:hypothetical protein
VCDVLEDGLLGRTVVFVVSLVLPVLLLSFAQIYTWGPPYHNHVIYCRGGAETSSSYPTLMFVVGVLSLICLCCSTCLQQFCNYIEVMDEYFTVSIGMVCCCIGLPLLAASLMMWIYMASSPPECGSSM